MEHEFWQGVDDIPTGTPPMIGKRLTEGQWLDYLAKYRFGPVAPDRVVLHHTIVPNEAQWNGLATMRGMQSYYAKKGWTAGPHIYAAPDGIWLFTPMDQVGIHANAGNGSLRQGWHSIGLEMVGSFDKVRPSGVVWNYSRLVLGSLCLRFKKTPEQAISFHRDYTSTKSCPGWAVTKPWVYAEVGAWMRENQNGTQKRWLVQVTATSGLNIRQGRSTSYPIAGKLAYGERVVVDDDTDGWLHLADERGFVSKQYTRAV